MYKTSGLKRKRSVIWQGPSNIVTMGGATLRPTWPGFTQKFSFTHYRPYWNSNERLLSYCTVKCTRTRIVESLDESASTILVEKWNMNKFTIQYEYM